MNIDNKDKTQSLPKKPIGIISKWQKRETDDARLNKPSILRILPDILLYSDNKFWSAPKMRVDLE